jgi:deoxyhypusine synthase
MAKKRFAGPDMCYEHNVPIFCPAFTDSSAGFGLVKHQWDNPGRHITIDSIKDFLELTKIKMAAPSTGLFMIGGGVPKNLPRTLLFVPKYWTRKLKCTNMPSR